MVLFRFVIICCVVVAVASLAKAAGAECFQPLPLADLSSRDTNYFKDLAEWKSPIPKAKEVKRFLPPDSGVGDIVNIDFYYVIFKKPSTKTLEETFKDVRFHFGDFARGSTGDYDFQPYGTTLDLSDYAKENKKKWETNDPTGVLMTFKLDTQYPNPKTFIQKSVKLIMVVNPWGSVQMTCATGTDFIFSTVDIQDGWTHPVAGNRGFGLLDAGNGNWMFYSKAVDRQSDSPFNRLGSKSVFCYGHLFWLNFYSNMQDYLNKSGMPVQRFVSSNRGTAWWPFRPTDPPPVEPKCE